MLDVLPVPGSLKLFFCSKFCMFLFPNFCGLVGKMPISVIDMPLIASPKDLFRVLKGHLSHAKRPLLGKSRSTIRSSKGVVWVCKTIPFISYGVIEEG